MTIGSLCSGACDGLSLGLEWAGIGPVRWQVEIEADRRANLARHWPKAKQYDDVKSLTGDELEPVSIIVCSSPCQDLSSAGARAGLDGPRSRVWWDCLRIIGETRPRWAVVENVASGANRWVPHVREGLERCGYSTLPVELTPRIFGTQHDRPRVFIVANLDGSEQHVLPVHAKMAGVPATTRRHAGWPTGPGEVHGIPRWLGDAVVPQCAEVIGWMIREIEDKEQDQ